MTLQQLMIDPDQFDTDIHSVLHLAMDRLIELGSLLNIHHDILDEDEEAGSANQLLRAQIGIQNGEDEIEQLQALIQCTSRLLIERNARSVIIDDVVGYAINAVPESPSSARHPDFPDPLGGGSDPSDVPEGGSPVPGSSGSQA